MNLSKIAKTAARVAKENPAVTLGLLGLVAPGLARRLGPVIVAAAVKRGG